MTLEPFGSTRWQGSLHVTPDNMRVFLVLEPAARSGRAGAGSTTAPRETGAGSARPAAAGRFPATAEDARRALRDHGIAVDLDEAAIQRACSDPAAVCLLVAAGSEPVDGADGRLELLLPEEPRRPWEREDGSVDYRERGPWLCLRPGDPIARLIPPREGVPGRDVFGRALPARAGRPVRVQAGRGVQVQEAEDGTRLYLAAGEGRAVVRQRGRADFHVEVRPLLEIAGNVDLATGHVRYRGDVMVAGDVVDDMVVEAAGDVLVRGAVHRAAIRTERAAEVRGGAFQSIIRAGTHARLNYVHHTTVEAGQTVEIGRRGAYLSRLQAPLVMVRGPVIGGEVHAGRRLEAVEAGSELGSPTLLSTSGTGVLRVGTAHPQVRVRVGRHTLLLVETERNVACRVVNGELMLR